MLRGLSRLWRSYLLVQRVGTNEHYDVPIPPSNGSLLLPHGCSQSLSSLNWEDRLQDLLKN